MPTEVKITSSMLNRRIIIQSPVDIPDQQGGFTRTWQTVAGCTSVPCSITQNPVPRKGDETVNAQQVYSTNLQTFTIRFRPSVNIKDLMRILYGNRIYNIRSVNVPDEHRTIITMFAEELQTEGSQH